MVVDSGNAVANALYTKKFDGFADFLRSADFAGVHKAMETE